MQRKYHNGKKSDSRDLTQIINYYYDLYFRDKDRKKLGKTRIIVYYMFKKTI